MKHERRHATVIEQNQIRAREQLRKRKNKSRLSCDRFPRSFLGTRETEGLGNREKIEGNVKKERWKFDRNSFKASRRSLNNAKLLCFNLMVEQNLVEITLG